MFVLQFGINKTLIQTITDLINTNLEYDKFSEKQVEHLIYDDPNFSNENILCGYFDNKLISFLCGVKSVYKNKKIGWIKIFVVDKKYRRQGFSKQMFNIIEKKFSDCDEVRIMDSVPCYFQPGVDPRYTEAVVFLEELGYKKIGENIHLLSKLNNLNFDIIEKIETEIKKQNYFITQGSKQHYENLLNWIDKVFPAWEFEVKHAYKYSPPRIYITLYNNKIVGFSCYNTTSEGWFGPIGVDPQHRKVGLGKILLLYCLKDMYQLGYKEAVIPWISPTSLKFYLSTCNAKIYRCFWVYNKEIKKL